MAWRIGICFLGIAWSVVLWRQQVLTEESQVTAIGGAVNKAVEKANSHSDQKIDSVKTDLGKDLTDQIGATNKTIDKLAGIVKNGQSDLQKDFKTIKPFTPGQAKLMFGLWSDNQTDDDFPLTFQAIQGTKDGTFAIHFFLKNISEETAGKGDMWVTICQGCRYVKEPEGFVKRAKAPEQVRNRSFDHLDSGVSFEPMTIEISAPKESASVHLELKYSCGNCPILIHNSQDFTIYTLW